MRSNPESNEVMACGVIPGNSPAVGRSFRPASRGAGGARRVLMAVALSAGLILAPAGQGLAATEKTEAAGVDAGLGVATVVANLFYVPAKLVYAIVGGVTGGLAYVVTGGSEAVAESVLAPSVGGDYVLSPDMLAGRKPIRFSGLREADEPEAPVRTPAVQDPYYDDGTPDYGF